MSYTIPPGTPKAISAARFGAELVKAARARRIPLKELERATGIGHTSLDNYRRGALLPKTEKAYVLAEVLDWPRLRQLIDGARMSVCGNRLCARTFRNEGGSPKRYCCAFCRSAAANQRLAAVRQTRAARNGKPQTRAAAARLRAAATRDTRLAMRLYQAAIEQMCGACEPGGLCRDEACPLRTVSPLPLQAHDVAQPRTEFEIRSQTWTPERKTRHVARMHELWATDPKMREVVLPVFQAAKPKAIEASRRATAKRSHASFSRASKKAWRTRRERMQAAQVSTAREGAA